MKKLLFTLTVFAIALSSCNKSKCYTCDKERTNGSVSTIEKCFNQKDKRYYVKEELDKYEKNGYKCKAQLFD